MTEPEFKISAGPNLLLAVQVVIEGNRAGVSIGRIQTLLSKSAKFPHGPQWPLDGLMHIAVPCEWQMILNLKKNKKEIKRKRKKDLLLKALT